MKGGIIIGFLALLIITSFITGICELSDPISADRVEQLNSLTNVEFEEDAGWLSTAISGIKVGVGYLEAFFLILWWGSPFFVGSYSLVYFVMYIPVGLYIMYAVVTTWVRGTST